MSEFDRLYAQGLEYNAPGQFDHVLSEDEARALVEAAEQRIRDDAVAYVAKRLVAKSTSQEAARQRQAAEAKRKEAEHQEALRKARRAHKQLYGRKLAGLLDPEARYDILPIEGRTYAFDAGTMERVWTLARDQGLDAHPSTSTLGVAGYQLGRVVGAGQLAGVNPSVEELQKLGAELRAARRKAEEREHEVQQRERAHDRELQTFGVAVGEAPDEE